MSWEKRRGGWFYYRARRTGGKVVKEYIGTGLAAERIAKRDEAMRAKRIAQRHAELELRRHVMEASTTLAELSGNCDDLVTAALAEAGIYQHHRGEWRHYGGGTNKKA
jgi:hypothetical protein